LSEVKVFKLERDEVLRRLRAYAEKKLGGNVLAIVLIGSLARGDYTAFSDADLVVIVESDPRRPMDRALDFIDPSLGVDVEPRVYTLEEIFTMCRQRRLLVKEVLEHGLLLAGDPKLLERLRECYESAL